jgi:branched-chain amino acid transport system permease protein
MQTMSVLARRGRVVFSPPRNVDDKLIEFIQQLINGLSQGAIYALVALGYTMVFGVLRFINFAHGDIYMLGAFAGAYVIPKVSDTAVRFAGSPDIARELTGIEAWIGPRETIYSLVLVLMAVMTACALFGVIVEILCYKPLRPRPRITVLITAIGVSLFIESMGQFLFGAAGRPFPELVPGAMDMAVDLSSFGERWGNLTLLRSEVIIFLVTPLLLIGLTYLVKRTKIGMAMRALAFNPTACSLMGVNVNFVISFTFGLGSALGGAAGVLISIKQPQIEPLMGILPGLKAFVAAVLGGIGNLSGAVLGGLIIGVVEALVVGYVSSTYRDAVAFSVLIIILLIKPSGLLGTNTKEKV